MDRRLPDRRRGDRSTGDRDRGPLRRARPERRPDPAADPVRQVMDDAALDAAEMGEFLEHAGGRSARTSRTTPRRGPAARPGAAGPRRAHAPFGRLRRVGGRGAGGAARRRGPLAPRGCPAPAGLAAHAGARRLIDQRRSDHARDGREVRRRRARRCAPPSSAGAASTTTRSPLLFLCCHPALSRLGRRADAARGGGFTTARSRAPSSCPRHDGAAHLPRETDHPAGVPLPAARGASAR